MCCFADSKLPCCITNLSPFALSCTVQESNYLSTSAQTRDRANYFHPVYRHTLLSLGNGANLSDPTILSVLANVVRHFVPMVTDDGKSFLSSMLQCSPLETYMTASDLAFAILILEHHLMSWRLAFQRKLEDGLEPKEHARKESMGLVYQGGIAGRQAKERFNALQLYVCENFYSKNSPDTMNRLQVLLNRAAREDPEAIRQDVEKFNKHAQLFGNILTIGNDVLHRIFYYMYV